MPNSPLDSPNSDPRGEGPGPHGVDRRGLLAAALVHAGVAALLYSDAIISAGRRVVSGPDTEVWPFLWGRFWMARSLGQGQLPLRTDLLDFPAGGTLWVKDPVAFLLTLPLQLVAGIPAAFTACGVLLFTFSGVGFFLLARLLGAGRWVAILAGLTFAFCPHALGEAYNANTEAFAGGWCALWLWSMLRAARRPRPGAVILAGVILAGLLITNQYFALAMAVVSGPLLWLDLRGGGKTTDRARSWRPSLTAVGASVLLGLALFAPVAWVIHLAISAPDKLNTLPAEVPLKVPNVTDLKHLLLPLSELSGPQTLEAPFQDLVYPGFLLAAAALAAPWLGPRGPWRWFFPAAGLFFLVMSLGPALMVDGHLVTRGGEPVHLPWYYLVSGRPLVGNMSLPHRLAIPTGLFLSLGLAWSARGLGDRLGARQGAPRPLLAALPLALILLALVEILAYPPYRIPLATVEASRPAHARLLAGLPHEGAVLNLPFQSHHHVLRRYMWWQAVHGRPIAASLRHSSLPTVAARDPWIGQAARAEKYGTRQRPAADPGVGRRLASMGFGFVVFHGKAYREVFPRQDSHGWLTILSRSLGQGLALTDGTVVFALDPALAGRLGQEAPRFLSPGEVGR